jgi:hypothetical protein
MLYFPANALAATENDRLRTAARYRLLAKVSCEQATLAREERRSPRWRTFRVSPTTGNAS